MDFINEKLKGRYLVEAKIGEGGMGTVYRAVDEVKGTPVAVKRLRIDHTESETMTARFLREAEVPRHENIVTVLDRGEHNGALFIVMEYLEGEDLGTMMNREGPLDLHSALFILEPVLSALEAAHGKNIIHRDLTPRNIILARGPDGERKVKVIDFGIAKFVGGTVYTAASDIIGTLNYMSPEQCNSAAYLDHRTDIWAVGVILYEMLTGRCPFAAGSNVTMVYNIIACDPPPLKQAEPNAPKEAEPLIQWLLKKDPEERPSSVREVLNAIRQLMKTIPLSKKVRRPSFTAPLTKEVPLPSFASAAEVKSFRGYSEITQADISRPFAVEGSRPDTVPLENAKPETDMRDVCSSTSETEPANDSHPAVEIDLADESRSPKGVGRLSIVWTTVIILSAIAAIAAIATIMNQ